MRFVLVHGGFHGAWCWSKVIPELEALGHEVLAVDLPGAGERLNEIATHASWRAAFRDVIEDGDVVVGHSLGGFAVCLAADEVPERIGRLVFLSAAVAVDGESMFTVSPIHEVWPDVVGAPHEEFVGSVEVAGQGPCIAITKPDAANTLFYHDCSPEDQAWAFQRLTPLSLDVVFEPFDLPRFSQTTIPRDYIVCLDDYSHPIAWDAVHMRHLGLSTCRGIVSSHSPMISKPTETARLLDSCARSDPR